MSPSEQREESVIELDMTPGSSRSEQDVIQQLPRTRTFTRYLIAVTVGAMIAVTATMLIMGPPSRPFQPQNLDELEAWLHEELTTQAGDGVHLVNVSGTDYTTAHVVVPDGSYRLAAKCGTLANIDHEAEVGFVVETPRGRHEVLMACPSTIVWLDEPLDLDEVAPVALSLQPLQDYNSISISVAIVPEEG